MELMVFGSGRLPQGLFRPESKKTLKTHKLSHFKPVHLMNKIAQMNSISSLG